MGASGGTQINTTERLSEVAQILAIGLQRLLARKSSPLSAHDGERSLDCPAHQSGHADALSHGVSQ